jgi:hypothetical protein
VENKKITHLETRGFDVARNGSAQIVSDGVAGLLADATWVLEIPLFKSLPHLNKKGERKEKRKSINGNGKKRREGEFRSDVGELHNCIAQKTF